MVTSMEDIWKGAEGTAQSIEEVRRTAQTQLEAVSEIVDRSESLAALAEELRGVLRNFRTGNEPVEGEEAAA